jgi:hypothetical protein
MVWKMSHFTGHHTLLYAVGHHTGNDPLLTSLLQYRGCKEEAEHQVSGAAGSGSEARADAGGSGLHTLVRRRVGLAFRHSRSLRERGHGGFPAPAWAECRAETGLTRQGWPLHRSRTPLQRSPHPDSNGPQLPHRLGLSRRRRDRGPRRRCLMHGSWPSPTRPRGLRRRDTRSQSVGWSLLVRESTPCGCAAKRPSGLPAPPQ